MATVGVRGLQVNCVNRCEQRTLLSRPGLASLTRPQIARPRNCSLTNVQRGTRSFEIRAVAEVEKTSSSKSDDVTVTIDNKSDPKFTIVTIEASNHPGLLTAVTGTFLNLGLDVGKASVDGSENRILDKFYVTEGNGKKVTDKKELDALKLALETLLEVRSSSSLQKRPQLFTGAGASLLEDRKPLLETLMGTLSSSRKSTLFSLHV